MSHAQPLQSQDQPTEFDPSAGDAPACQICRRQDETVRIVSYPFVFSFVVVTFRRAYTGIWCARHRRRFLLFASVITSTLGWLGIPHGIIWTPLTLLKLARGGIQPPEANARMLKTFAEKYLKNGDFDRAVKCLEESQRFEDDPAILARIASLRTLHFISVSEPGCIGRIGSIIGLVLLAGLTGTMAAGVDSISTLILSSVFADVTFLFVVILSWAPMIVVSFVAGLALFYLVESAVARLHLTSRVMAVSLALAASLVAVYGMLEGYTLAEYLGALASPGAFASAAEAIGTGVIVLAIGGALYVPALLQPSSLADVIFSMVIAAILVYVLVFSWRASNRAAEWQRRVRG